MHSSHNVWGMPKITCCIPNGKKKIGKLKETDLKRLNTVLACVKMFGH